MEFKPSISHNTSPLGFNIIYKLDDKGIFKYVSPRMASFMDMDAKDILDCSFMDFVRSDFGAQVESFYQQQAHNGTPSTYLEFPVVNNKGHESWIGQTVEMVIENSAVKEILAVASDVTEKILAQQFASRSEEKYRSLIENIKLGLMEVDLEERILFANRSFCEITGYSLSEILGKKASEIFLVEGDDESRTQIDSANQKRLEGESSAYELKVKRKDGTPIWVIISGTPIKNEKGEIIGSVGIHNDITPKKQEELERQELLQKLSERNQLLQEKQEYLATINEFVARLIKASSIPEIVAEITRNTVHKFGFEDCVVYLMDDEEEYLRQVSAYGLKNNSGQIVEPILIPVGKGIVGSVALKGEPEIVSDTRKDPRYITDMVNNLSELAVPIIADGKTIGVIDSEHSNPNFYTQDHLQTLVTISSLVSSKIKSAVINQKREEAEEALKESETKLRSVINSALDAVLIIDEKGEILEWNPRAVEIFGHSEQQAVGQKMTRLIIHTPFQRIMEMGLQAFTESGKAPMLNKRIEIQGVNRDGQVFPTEFSVVPILLEEKPVYSVFVRDITQEKKVNHEMMNALEREKELNEMKSRLVSMTSHEFRTPLTTIKTNIELLSYHLDYEKISKRDKMNRNIERIHSQIERLNVLMNDVLMMGRLESGKISNTPALTDIYKLCKNLIRTNFSHLDDGRTVDLSFRGEQREVFIDPNIYTHIITNLLSNAFKYSPGAENPLLHISYGEESLKIQVADSGIGIPEKDLPHIFDSFFRSDNSENIQGTGLGLAIVKEFCNMQGASIAVESRLCWGSKFTIEQPYQKLAGAAKKEVQKITTGV